MSRPKIYIKKTRLDYFFEGISIISLALTFIIIAYYWGKYPNSVAIHYNALGQADSFGHRWLLLILPLTALLTYIGMTYLNKFPHVFNFPVEVSERNAELLYKTGKRTISFMKMIVCLLILYINISQVSSMIFNRSGINIFIILFFILCLIVAPIFAAFKMSKARP
ncbi:MAG TPA: DUF1648 domain-containing protein [Bacteroidales bacterium]|nr:DUF1648 domain-containing protein [Bacteroidales bacterium]HRT00711.1 DUF1648 domain-containing protein [Bacteroidales bacterium]